MKTRIAWSLVKFCVCLYLAQTAIQGAALKAEQPAQEFYELRIYKIFDYDKQQLANRYLKDALLPALNRMGIDRVGVFTNKDDENDHSLFVLIPYPTIEKFTGLSAALAEDTEYQSAAAPTLIVPTKTIPCLTGLKADS